jgi:hypothetical protein
MLLSSRPLNLTNPRIVTLFDSAFLILRSLSALSSEISRIGLCIASMRLLREHHVLQTYSAVDGQSIPKTGESKMGCESEMILTDSHL